MSSSSCMHGSVCPQLPRWRASATNPVQRWLYPPSTAMLTAHLASPSWGHHWEQKGSAHALAQLCSRLQVHLFRGMPFPVTISEHKVQNATLLLPQANTGEEAPTCCSCEQPPRFVLKGFSVAVYYSSANGQEPVSTLSGLVNFMFVIPGWCKESNSLVCEKPRVGSAKQRTGKLLWAALDPSGWAQIIPLQSHKAASVGESHHSNDSLR